MGMQLIANSIRYFLADNFVFIKRQQIFFKKVLNMKRILVFLLLCISFSGFGQEKAEPQPFPLIDYKISFYEVQMNAETVAVTALDGAKIAGVQPKIILDEANNSFTIDFTECKEGKYLITGKRDALKLEYTVDR